MQTDRLLLRPWTAEDAPALRQLQHENFEHLQPFMPWSNRLYTLMEMECRIEGWNRMAEEDEHVILGVFLRSTGEPIGEVGLHSLVMDAPLGLQVAGYARSLSYWVGKGSEGRGLAYEAARGVLDAFPDLSVVLLIQPDNTRSIRLGERLGFTIDSTRSSSLILVFGRE